jgi:hypothetical protein
MSIAIGFEKILLEKLEKGNIENTQNKSLSNNIEHEHKNTNTKHDIISENATKETLLKSPQITNTRYKYDSSYTKSFRNSNSENSYKQNAGKEKSFPHAVTLFAGICMGVGLASHALILKW